MKLRIRNRTDPYADYYKTQYAPAILKKNYTNVNSFADREKRIEEDPVAYCLTIRVAMLLTKNPPIFMDENDEEIEKIKDFWLLKGYDTVLRNVIIGTRTHGFCGTEALKTAFMGNDFFVYTLKDLVTVNYDVNDQNIKSYTVLPQMEQDGEKMMYVGVPEQREVEIKNLLHYAIGRKKNNQQGVPSLKPVWAQMIRANEILESMAAYDSRIGHGWLVALAPKEVFRKPALMTALDNAIKNMNNKRYLVLPTSKDFGSVDLKFVGGTSTVDFGADLNTILGYISAATGLPIRFFIGDPKGAQAAAKEDKVAIVETLKSIFAEYKEWIRSFIEMFMEDGETINKSIKEIEFDDEGVLDEFDVEGDEMEEEGMDEENPGKHKEDNNESKK